MVSFTRDDLSSRGAPAAHDRIDDADDVALFGDVVHAHDVDSGGRGQRDRRRRAERAPVDVAPEQPADRRLARRTDQRRKAQRDEPRQRAEQAEIVFRRLPKADARIEDDVLGRQSGAHAAFGRRRQAAQHLIDHVAFVDRDAFVVHRDDRRAGGRAGIDQFVARAPDRIEQIAAGGVRAPKDAGLERVDRHDRPASTARTASIAGTSRAVSVSASIGW